MKRFLIDENLPRTLRFPRNYHFTYIVDFGRQMSDTEIWEYAIENKYTNIFAFYEKRKIIAFKKIREIILH